MTELLRRTSAADLEVRGDGRTIVGIAVPFDTPAEIRSATGAYTEVFRRGAFARTIAERGPGRVKLLSQHDTARNPLGRATVLREDAAGLYGEFRVSKTGAGDELLTLVADGAIDAFSVGFKPITQKRGESGQVERTEVALFEVSAVAFPVYEGALISAVRSEPKPSPRPLLAARRAALTDLWGTTHTMTTTEARKRLLAWIG